MQNISELNIERVRVITVAKVASSAFSHSLSQKFKTSHGHSLQLLKDVLANEENTLVISGIRNPLARNLSYFFQTYNDKKHNDVKCKSNKYKGEKCFAMSEKDLLSSNAEKLIDVFFKQKWHETFNHWFKEFLELTQIDKQGFNKETGFQLYPLDNNNWLLIYTFEKLKDNTPYFEEFFGIQDLSHTNNPNDRVYKDLYKEVKSKITFDSVYSKMLLDTDIVRLFYCREDIERFINGAL
tara:strand:+ start:1043 stop:1759 length:717 start_codon:yes stop_codon:yes gene_type:complete